MVFVKDMAEYFINRPTDESHNHFKEGSWYAGKDTEKGIIAKVENGVENNHGWWGGTFAKNYFNLITPDKWEEVTDPREIKRLENKLKRELE